MEYFIFHTYTIAFTLWNTSFSIHIHIHIPQPSIQLWRWSQCVVHNTVYELDVNWNRVKSLGVCIGRPLQLVCALEVITYGKSYIYIIWYIYLLTAIGLSPGGSSTVHIYTQTVHRTKRNKQYIEQHNNLGECGPCPIWARFALAFALQLRKKHGKTSVRVAASKNT
jgi:hypothetical protein